MKQVIALSGLLAVALVGSYLTWTDDGSGRANADAVPLYAASTADLQKVVWESERFTIELTRPEDHVWVVSTERRKRPVQKLPELAEADAEGVADGEEPEDEGEGEEPEMIEEEDTTAFLGNKSAEETWERFTPLHALRQLGQASALDLSALGFDEPEATLTITRRSGPLELVVGGEAYGSKDRYVKMGDAVYLLDDAILRPLQFASTRMVERALHPLSEREVRAVETSLADGRSLSLVQQHRDDRARAYWARGDSPDTAEDAAGTWLGKVFRMRVNGYITDDMVEGLQPVFTFKVDGDGESWTVEVLQGVEDGKEQLYARSTFNRSLVRLTQSLAQEAVADLDAVFGG